MRLPLLKAREVIVALEKAGFHIHHQRGSHVRLVHRTRPELRLTVPVHSGDMPRATLRRILRQAQIPLVEFLKLLD